MTSPAFTGVVERWRTRDSAVPDLPPHARSLIELRDPHGPTRYACLFLHGFNGVPGEVGPHAAVLAENLGMNFLAPRLPGHGVARDDAMRGVSCVDWIAAVDAAYQDAGALGQEVVVIGSSLGGSLALQLASHRAVAALVLWSPGIAPVESRLLDDFCAPGDRVITDTRKRTPAQQRWNRAAVHADGFRAMRDLFEGSMHRHTFARVTAPTWLGFYYRDEAQQDPTASVSAMRTMFEQLGTPAAQRQAVTFADAAHNLASPERSAAAADVLAQSEAFLRQHLELSVPAT